MSLRRRLSLLVAIGLTPPFLLTVFNTARWQIQFEDNARTDAVADARLVATEVTQIIDGSRQLLLALSKYPVSPNNEAECTSYFKSIITELPIYRAAAIIDSEGRFHCSTIPIPPDLNVTDRIYFREPLATGKFTIGTLTEGRVTHATSVHLSLPYKGPEGSFSGVITLILNPEKMARELAALPWHTGHRVIVLDRKGSIVLSLPKDDLKDAEIIARGIFPRLIVPSSDTIETDVIPERPQIVGVAPVGDGPGTLMALVTVDRKAALAEAWSITARSLAIGLVTILLAIACVWIATHYFIIRPIRAVVETARRRERGDTAVRFPAMNQLSEIGQLSSSLSQMSDKVDELLSQKALLLRELQHRVMNSLNLLSSVFDMQGRQRQSTPETRAQLARARDRVVAMGAVYRHLYQSNAVDDVEIDSLLKAICKDSESAYEGPVRLSIEVETETTFMSGTNAMALAMLTHELITNAVKHAYSEGELGPISVKLKHTSDGGLEYRFADHGRGLPEDFKVEASDSLGMKMIAATARQLSGTLTINGLNPGTEFVLLLPPEIQQQPKV
jgi:two-component sensor histidine kinase